MPLNWAKTLTLYPTVRSLSIVRPRAESTRGRPSRPRAPPRRRRPRPRPRAGPPPPPPGPPRRAPPPRPPGSRPRPGCSC